MPDIPGQPAPRAEPSYSRTATHDGLWLAGEHHSLPSGRARIVLVHGFGEHRGRYRLLVEDLLAVGYECDLFDLRGHGESGGTRGHVGHFDDYLDDLQSFLTDSWRPAAGGSVLFAHSLGGLIALEFVLKRWTPFTAMVLSSPFLAPALDLPRFLEASVQVVSRVLPNLRMDAPVDASTLSRDAQVVEQYRSDPQIVRSLTMSWAAATARAQDEVYRRAAEVTLPALFLIGDGDRVAEPKRTREVFERLGSADKQLVEYPGFLHEVLNEPERRRVVADLTGWLDERFPRRSEAGGAPPR